MNGHLIRVAVIAGLTLLTGLASARMEPAAEKSSAAPNLEALLPEEFGVWRRVGISQAVLPAESELAPGEAVAYRAYKDNLGRIVTLVVAYGPPLGDSVRLHRPETCYAAQGFEVLSRRDSEILARGRPVPIVNLETQSPARREAVSYWLRAGDGFTTKSSDAGWRRLKGGADRLDGALLRISTTYGEKPPFDMLAQFLAEFASALDPAASSVLLGRERAQ